jgi:hypothetical protein
MQKRKLVVLLASTILIAGILVAGCTDSSSSVETSNSLSTIPPRSHAADTAAAGDAGQPQYNESAGPMGTPGIQMNGTQPSGNPPGDMKMNGTRPSGTPPEGMQMNGTRPSGSPPDGMQMDGSGPSGTPPSGTPSS